MGDVSYIATLAGGRLDVRRGEPQDCVVLFSGSTKDMVAAVHGGAGLEVIEVKGDIELAKRFITLFPLAPKLSLD